MLFLLTIPASLTPGRPVSGRRAALQGAASAVVLPAIPFAANAKSAVDMSPEVNAGFGQTGRLRADEPVSLTGSGVEITITDLSYTELRQCPKNFFIPAKEGPWSCIEISGTAFNQGKRDVKAADVFGQLLDAEGFSAASTALDPTQKTPFATVEATFTKGVKVPVKWVTAVQVRSPRPFTFAGIKANYRNAAMANTFKAFDPCEIDSSACEDGEDQPSNADALRQGKGFSYKQ